MQTALPHDDELVAKQNDTVQTDVTKLSIWRQWIQHPEGLWLRNCVFILGGFDHLPKQFGQLSLMPAILSFSGVFLCCRRIIFKATLLRPNQQEAAQELRHSTISMTKASQC